ncbi:kinase-like domain-containing protein [Glomus cerebriforme]|uniref:Kinase-like domain-containing protein n=1 Tax=Glomus cerebriforme TaxID=658196 RepID=A0A397S9T3_9GLOM|nr:kinase-like domain-containing protein [Glomus cerebriforme]
MNKKKGMIIIISFIISLYLKEWGISSMIFWITGYSAISSIKLELMIPGLRFNSVKIVYNGFSIMTINMIFDVILERFNVSTFLQILQIIIQIILVSIIIRFLEIPKIKVTRESGIIIFYLVETWKLFERTAKYVVFSMIMKCGKCGEIIYGTDWCQNCLSTYLTNNQDWTSGNDIINNIIKETQYKPANQHAYIEWIPYERLKDIKLIGSGGFGTVYMGTWIDGPIYMRGRKIFRKERNVAIKSLGSSNNVSEEFLKELRAHIRCLTIRAEHHRDWIVVLRCFGLTQDPKTKAYMIVTDHAKYGDLQNYLKQSFSSLKWLDDKLRILVDISKGLKLIHDVGLVHHDLHSGNILIGYNKSAYIADFGLSHPADYNDATPGLFGVLPFIAPELFRGNKYTKESDIYSFGIIMWVISSGRPPYCDQKYDLYLALDICKNKRPNIIEGTPKCYVDLMERCWHSDPSKRPNTDELYDTIRSWYFWKNHDQFIAADKLDLTNYSTETFRNNQYFSKFINLSVLSEIQETEENESLDAYRISLSSFKSG